MRCGCGECVVHVVQILCLAQLTCYGCGSAFFFNGIILLKKILQKET